MYLPVTIEPYVADFPGQVALICRGSQHRVEVYCTKEFGRVAEMYVRLIPTRPFDGPSGDVLASRFHHLSVQYPLFGTGHEDLKPSSWYENFDLNIVLAVAEAAAAKWMVMFPGLDVLFTGRE